ncbi:MAG: hypothetical protein FDX21_01940 [Chlorobium sp.]|nr:MAG: hypothetical protein FDX21_01940 [Chlorobium sp.]
MAGWDNYQPKIIGGSIDFPTVITEWSDNTFKHYPAFYGEDICLLSTSLRRLVQECPKGNSLPKNVGLCEFFIGEKILRWRSNCYGDAPMGIPAYGYVGEYSSHSVTMIKVMKKFGSTLGSKQDGTIFEMNDLTTAVNKNEILSVTMKSFISDDGDVLPNIFLTCWSDENEKQQIVASFTHGISSFTGNPIVRVQITSNSNLPDRVLLQRCLASLLAAGQQEIQVRQWGTSKEKIVTTEPVAPQNLIQKKDNAELNAGPTKMFIPKIGAAGSTPLIEGSALIMRIHAIKEPEIVATLKTMGASIRMLGKHQMLPAVLNFKNIPKHILNMNSSERIA